MNGVSQMSRMLYQMEQMKTAAQAGAVGSATSAIPASGSAQGTKPVEFGKIFSQAINGVNDTQHKAAELAAAFEMGDNRVDITQVMIASQKAAISFQAMTQVRNRMVEAYKEIMGMPI